MKTAEELAALRLDTHTICAGLLHDVLEDTGTPREEMDIRFGQNITNLVEGVTKIGKYKFRGGHRQRQAETYRKLLLATAEDMRVILIKLADRVHNMETLKFLPAEKCQRIAKETLEIYAPHRTPSGHLARHEPLGRPGVQASLPYRIPRNRQPARRKNS